ncbi:hypothetical protein TSUD_88280 [Trifolium subterraneum]|uniref:HMA domain-containing protein n=1 Tax=Trifolium subterraneum TaxID=3900 RepID=A0A2Z6NWJ7_TRISU|nr:hypothetical protein TSUD_88280 [Trifolium subterraneum]
MHCCCNRCCKSCTSKGSTNNNNSWFPDEKREMNGFDDNLKKPLLRKQDVEVTPSITDAKNIKEARVNVNKLKEKETFECRIKIKGMNCIGCSKSVQHALQRVEGVNKAVIGSTLDETKVLYDPKLMDTNKIIEVVEDSGFEAELVCSRKDINQVLLCCLFSVVCLCVP